MRTRTVAFRVQGFRAAALFLIWLLLVSAFAHAGTVSPTDEYRKLITAGQSIQPLGMHPFGESINLYNGSLSFEVTDISIPGTGPTLSLSRSLETASGRSIDPLDRDQPFGDWDLDIPHIKTGTADQYNVTGWFVASYGNAGYLDRCTDFVAPPPVNATGAPPWSADQWWHGYNLVIPGDGSQTLLAGGPVAPAPATGTWPIDTKQNWRVGCGVTASDGGEGFVALAPDGTRYYFEHLIYRPMAGLTKPLDDTPDAIQANGVHPLMAPFDILTRREGQMYVTKVVDRFGNTLTYNWSSSDPNDPVNNHLSSIVASDGRELDFKYISGTPLIHTITEVAFKGAPTRVWTYSYDTSGVEPSLTTVQLPDGHDWSYQLGAFQTAVLVTQVQGDCTNGSSDVSVEDGGTPSGSMTAPSGLRATFTLQFVVHGRSDVPLECRILSGDPAGFPRIPDQYAQYSLVEEDLSGPGLPAGNPTNDCKSGASFCWKYSYSPLNASWKSGSGSCSSTVYTDVTDPLGQDVRYTYSNCFDASEGKLLRTDSYSGAAGPTALRSVVDTYANPTGGPWPATYGRALQPYLNHPQLSEISPLKTTTITQDGATFTTSVTKFDDVAQPINTTESSSNLGANGDLSYSKTDTTSYLNDTNNWVLGLVTQIATNGIVDSQTSYDSLDQPTSQYVFGRLDSTSAWNRDGTLASITDGDGHQTTFSNWYRGVPETFTFADGTSKAATVNGDGWITSVTDENGFTTNYAYDPMGRLIEISYPTGDDVAWNPTYLSFAPVGSAELGIPGGHWKQVVHTGNDYTVTYFDAFWRPLVTDHYDPSSSAVTPTEIVHQYDADGRTIFTSYPTEGVSNYTQSLLGTSTSYDALDRVTAVDQDSSLGKSPTKTQYSPGFQTNVTDPRGYITTTSYQAYGAPTTEWPVSVRPPQGETTTIIRDVFGKPTSITRAGTPFTRYFTYNAYQELCGRTDPETGTTAYGYDLAGILVWSASGLGPVTGSCYSQPGNAVTRTYTPRNWLSTITYPDGFSSASYAYAPDGAMLTASMVNDGVSTAYTYDKRRLLTSEALSIPNSSTATLTYEHDANGHLDETIYPDNRPILYAPNALGQPTEAGGYATGVQYYPNGAIASFTFGNNIVHAMQETERQFVGSSKDSYNGTTFRDDVYAYDGDGNLAAITDSVSSVGNVTMSYDGLDRLTQAVSLMFGAGDCVFRSMPATDSGACRPGIPAHAGHPFRSMPAGVSEAG